MVNQMFTNIQLIEFLVMVFGKQKAGEIINFINRPSAWRNANNLFFVSPLGNVNLFNEVSLVGNSEGLILHPQTISQTYVSYSKHFMKRISEIRPFKSIENES